MKAVLMMTLAMGGLLLAGVLPAAAQGARQNTSPRPQAADENASPNGRFSLQVTIGDDFRQSIHIVETATGQPVADLTESVMPGDVDSVKLVWTKDSKCFAANYRAGNRYHTTSFFRWDEGCFVELSSPEATFYRRHIFPSKQEQMEQSGKPGSTSMRRIWDIWETIKWVDPSTVEIQGESISAYTEEPQSLPENIRVNFKATVHFDEAGRAHIMDTVTEPAAAH